MVVKTITVQHRHPLHHLGTVSSVRIDQRSARRYVRVYLARRARRHHA